MKRCHAQSRVKKSPAGEGRPVLWEAGEALSMPRAG